MNRKSSHFQSKEPPSEIILREMRFAIAGRYISENSTVADLGCGYHGKFLHRISAKIKSGVGFDISVSQNQRNKKIRLVRSNLNKEIRHPYVKFDYVVALAVLEHTENPTHLIKMARKILKKGGKLIITTPHERSKKILEFLAYRLGLISKNEILDHKNYFTNISLRNLISRNKLKIVRLETFEFGYNILCISEK